ncbi:MAG: hypothetical protein ACRDRL_34200 [Sciscionella sp.]
MSRSSELTASIALATVGVVGPSSYLAFTASAASASTVEIARPGIPACGNYAAATKYITYQGTGRYGLTQLSYSSCTPNAWGYGITYQICHYATLRGCVYDALYKSPSIREAYCISDTTGQPAGTCNTAQFTDAGITSYSYGVVYLNAGGSMIATGTTATY